MGSKGGGKQTTTNEPWSQAQPFIKDIMAQAQTQYRRGGPQYFPGQTFVGPTSDQMGAWNTALGYSNQVFGGQQGPRFGDATAALTGALRGGGAGQLVGGYSDAAGTALGQMLSGTPDYAGLQGSIDAANAPIIRDFEQNILPGLNQKASFLSNPTGGIKALNQVLPEMGQRMSQNALMATEGERQRALQAQQAGLGMFGQLSGQATDAALRGAGLFPTVAQAGQYPGQVQQAFADWRAGFDQQALQDQINRFNFEQNAPMMNLQNYNALVQGFGGLGGTQTSQMPGGSKLAGAAGGALSGAAAGSAIPGIGTAIGAILGGLGGYFG